MVLPMDLWRCLVEMLLVGARVRSPNEQGAAENIAAANRREGVLYCSVARFYGQVVLKWLGIGGIASRSKFQVVPKCIFLS